MYSRWFSTILLLFFTCYCNAQVRAPKSSTRTVHARISTNSDRTQTTRGNSLKKRPVETTERNIHVNKVDEFREALDTQKNTFVAHKRDFDNHILSIERRFSILTQSLQRVSSEMQELVRKNIDLEKQLKAINEQYVLVPKNKIDVAENENSQHNKSSSQARSVSKSTVEEYISNRGAELIEILPANIPKQEKPSQGTARSGGRKSTVVNNNSFNKHKSDYITDAILRLFTQDKHTNDRLLTLEQKMKEIDISESVTTTIIVEACNETDSTTEILELKDMEKRVSDLENHIQMEKTLYNQWDMEEENTNKIGMVEARGKKKYKNEVYNARAASDARKSLFSAARTTPFFGSDKEIRNITFNHLYVNKGKHFVHNSTFVCHLSGFYFFTFTIRSRDEKTPYVTLMKNLEPQTSISADKSSRNIMQSQSTILQLRERDQVWLRVGPNKNYALDSEERNKYITFTGFLIYKGS